MTLKGISAYLLVMLVLGWSVGLALAGDWEALAIQWAGGAFIAMAIAVSLHADFWMKRYA